MSVVAPSPAARQEISATEVDMLSFEREWWRYGGAKDEAIREKFDISASVYYQRLNLLIDKPEALLVDPVLVRRLQRVRQARQVARTGRHSNSQS